MATPVLSEIESGFALLPPEAQLSLLERLVCRTRGAVARRPDDWDADLAAIAADPEMQRELSLINAEFNVTETDGLEKRRRGSPHLLSLGED